MTLDQEPRVRGKIELITGRTVKKVPERMELEQSTIFPEDVDDSLYAAKLDPLVPFEDSMKIDKGRIWISTRRSPRKDQVEMLQNLGFDPKHTLIERWGDHDSIDTAMRATHHMRKDYDWETGIRTEHLKMAARKSNLLAHELQKPNLTLEKLEELQIQLARDMAETGLSSAYNIHFLEIANQLHKALTPDSLGRPNASRSRLIRGYAQPKIARALFVTRRPDVKNGNRNSLLSLERDFTQTGLKYVANDCEMLCDLNDYDLNLALKRFIPNAEYLLSTDYVKVNPYVETAALGRYLLSDMGEDAEEDLKSHVDDKTLDQILGMDLAPFNRMEPVLKRKILSSLSGIIHTSIRKSDKRLATSWEDSLFEDHE